MLSIAENVANSHADVSSSSIADNWGDGEFSIRQGSSYIEKDRHEGVDEEKASGKNPDPKVAIERHIV